VSAAPNSFPISSRIESRWAVVASSCDRWKYVSMSLILASSFFFGVHAVFELLALLHHRLGLFLILPEVCRVDFRVEIG
jgi:hypothetical protein